MTVEKLTQKQIEEVTSQLDDGIVRTNAQFDVNLKCDDDSIRFHGNQQGLQRMGIELLKASFAPLQQDR